MLGKTHFQNQNLVLKMGFFVNLYRIEVGKMKGNNEKKGNRAFSKTGFE